MQTGSVIHINFILADEELSGSLHKLRSSFEWESVGENLPRDLDSSWSNQETLCVSGEQETTLKICDLFRRFLCANVRIYCCGVRNSTDKNIIELRSAMSFTDAVIAN